MGGQVELFVIGQEEKPLKLSPLESNQKFDSIKMLVGKEKAFIMAEDKKYLQTLYVIYLDD
jgi:hypothetical protein